MKITKGEFLKAVCDRCGEPIGKHGTKGGTLPSDDGKHWIEFVCPDQTFGESSGVVDGSAYSEQVTEGAK